MNNCLCIGKPGLNKVFIYTLSDPITNEIRYVGKTIQKLSTRYSDHISFTKQRNKLNYYSKNWIKSLISQNLYPKMEILDIVDKNNWQSEEIFYISYFKYLGFNLTNHQIGGESGNEGCTWKISKEKRKNKWEKLKKERVENFILYDLKGNILKNYQNLLVASEDLNIKLKYLRNSIIKNGTIKNQYILLKDFESFKSVSLKRRYLKIRIYNDLEDLVFNTQLEVSKFLNKPKNYISLILSNKIKNDTNYKIEKYGMY